jgi:tRNA C32,U32 (ribose-2'-O)-methylase TrmJ
VPTALFLGNESSGLDPALAETFTGSVAIPMAGRAESLNVGVACAVLCFEALRQRRAGSSAPPTIPGNPSPIEPNHRWGDARGESTW